MKKNFFLVILMIMSCVNTFAQEIKKTSVNELTEEEKNLIFAGKAKIYDVEQYYEDLTPKTYWALVLFGGMNFAEEIHSPYACAGAQYVHKLFVTEINIDYFQSQKVVKYDHVALVANVGINYKIKKIRLTVLGGVGYGLQKSDKSDSQVLSENWGLEAKGTLRVEYCLAKKFFLGVQGSFHGSPNVIHGKTQTLDTSVSAAVGITYRF